MYRIRLRGIDQLTVYIHSVDAIPALAFSRHSIALQVQATTQNSMSDYDKEKSDGIADGVYPVSSRLEGDVTEEGLAMANDPHR